jgi:arsenate reductase
MSERSFGVLFLCTGNSARSIMAESILNGMSKGRFRAYSAGSHPLGEVSPYALELLQRHGYPTEGLRSKSWDEFAGPGAPPFDFVFTVCNRAAREACPVWPHKVMTANWSVDDPALVYGPDDVKRRAFWNAYMVLQRRIDLFTNLPIASLDSLRLQSEVDAIGVR